MQGKSGENPPLPRSRVGNESPIMPLSADCRWEGGQVGISPQPEDLSSLKAFGFQITSWEE